MSTIFLLKILHFLFICLLSFTYSEIIEIANYSYPKISDSDYYNVAILGTSDVHGTYFQKETKINDTLKIKTGGLDYLGRYVSILREEWGDRLLWLDGGDQFNGGFESRLSNGSIITDFYNIMGLNGATLGNHEFDVSQDYLMKRMNSSNFEYIGSNFMGESEIVKKLVKSKIFQLGEVKIGVIGLTTLTTAQTSGGNLTGIIFTQYKSAIMEESEKLRKEVNAIVLLMHIGAECLDKPEVEKMTLGIFDNSTNDFTGCTENDELPLLLSDLEDGLVDVVVASHAHDVIHMYYEGRLPVIQTKDSGKYFNIMYLRFKKDSNGKYFLPKNTTLIEGPVPICENIFNINHRCEWIDASLHSDLEIVNFTFHGKEMKREEKLLNLSDTWYKIYEEYVKQIIVKIDENMKISFDSECALGNLYSDFFRKISGADIAIINNGIFRTEWSAGNISIADLFAMNSFENLINSFEMTGYEVRKMLFQTQSGKRAYYVTSGLKQVVDKNKRKLYSFKIFDGLREFDVEDDKTYKIVSNDYLMPNGGDDFAEVVKWYTPKGLTTYGEMRELFINHMKFVDEIKVSKLVDPKNPRIRYKQNLRENEINKDLENMLNKFSEVLLQIFKR